MASLDAFDRCGVGGPPSVSVPEDIASSDEMVDAAADGTTDDEGNEGGGGGGGGACLLNDLFRQTPLVRARVIGPAVAGGPINALWSVALWSAPSSGAEEPVAGSDGRLPKSGCTLGLESLGRSMRLGC